MTEPNLLWQRLAAFELDQPGAVLSFSRRLARENGWSHATALAAIEEYRRFVFLAMAAGHPVTPSDEVDQVWHLHLCYTRSYWDELCGKVLSRPLHHGPTCGGDAERQKFADWYRQTLSSYERWFGERPPARFWPAPEMRFRRRVFRRVDVEGTVLLSRRKLQQQGLWAVCALLLLSIAGCTSLLGDDVGTLIMLFAVFGFGFLIWHLARSGYRGGGGGNHGADGDGGACGGGHHGPHGHDDHGGGDSGCGDAGCGSGCGGCGD